MSDVKMMSHKRAFLDRAQHGLQRLPRAWDGLCLAQSAQAARHAFKIASYHHRAAGQEDALQFVDQLSRVFVALVAREMGQAGAADWVDLLADSVPDGWTGQYPRYGVPDQAKEMT
jgi:plasmid stabilization system protein ParE